MCESSSSFRHGSTHMHQSFDQNRDTNCHAEIIFYILELNGRSPLSIHVHI
jgi:hypothetical protein